MEYTIYKLQFLNNVHFGINSLENTQYTFFADTFFSSLCIEAMKKGTEYLEELVGFVKSGQLLFSDAFPYIQEEYYLPKPMIQMAYDLQKEYKQMEYVPLSGLEQYLNGTLPKERTDEIKHLGISSSKISASIRGEEETLPYRIRMYSYYEGCGLYLLVRWESEQIIEYFEELLEGVSYSGIGGKRASGLGRFEFYRVKKIPELLEKRLGKKNGQFMTLSVSLPTESELDTVIEQASYSLEKRSGFVYSSDYALQQVRKKDLYVLRAGAYVLQPFSGDVYDVSSGGTHPVYRYAKPLFLEVSP